MEKLLEKSNLLKNGKLTVNNFYSDLKEGASASAEVEVSFINEKVAEKQLSESVKLKVFHSIPVEGQIGYFKASGDLLQGKAAIGVSYPGKNEINVSVVTVIQVEFQSQFINLSGDGY